MDNFKELLEHLKNPEVLERFWEKVDKSKNCWEWNAAKNNKGYGRFRINKRLYSPHVLTFILTTKQNPTGYDVCHKCDNPGCVNPNHLFLGTRQDNVLDCVEKGRHSRSKANPNIKFFSGTNNKLNEEEVREIKILLSRKIKQKEIAKLFNVNHRSISNINKKKTWAWVN